MVLTLLLPEEKKKWTLALFLLLLGSWFVPNAIVWGFLAALLLVILTYMGIRKYQKHKRLEREHLRLELEAEQRATLRREFEMKLESELDKYLRSVLENMDTTGNWYNNEEEANRELISGLKSQSSMFNDSIYQYQLPDGTTADAKVGNFLIEGKLSPKTAEVDRLIGQLGRYSKYGYKINVVIYGELSEDARRRIENEIQERGWLGEVFLTALDNPSRQRKPN